MSQETTPMKRHAPGEIYLATPRIPDAQRTAPYDLGQSPIVGRPNLHARDCVQCGGLFYIEAPWDEVDQPPYSTWTRCDGCKLDFYSLKRRIRSAAVLALRERGRRTGRYVPKADYREAIDRLAQVLLDRRLMRAWHHFWAWRDEEIDGQEPRRPTQWTGIPSEMLTADALDNIRDAYGRRMEEPASETVLEKADQEGEAADPDELAEAQEQALDLEAHEGYREMALISRKRGARLPASVKDDPFQVLLRQERVARYRKARRLRFLRNEARRTVLRLQEVGT